MPPILNPLSEKLYDFCKLHINHIKRSSKFDFYIYILSGVTSYHLKNKKCRTDLKGSV